jgi:small-conductance mechanosensitive channel
MGFFSVGPTGALHIYGVKLVGANAENARKLLLTLVFAAVVFGTAALLRRLVRRRESLAHSRRIAFWSRQGINIAATSTFVLVFVSVWFDDPARLTTGLGLVTAGLAFALQKVVTSLAGYIVILRGRTFNVGDRIVMGGVRGDVVALGFTQTTILEMGQPPDVQSAEPAMWVKSRQYTGRLVVVPNSKIFDEPVYNYTRDFDYIWEELSLPVAYRDDRQAVERILLEAARTHGTQRDELGAEVLAELQRRYYGVDLGRLEPRVFYRLTDNWLELTVRFLCRTHGVRDVKDAMSRDVLAALDAAEIGIASATFEVVGLPKLRIEPEASAALRAGDGAAAKADPRVEH